MNSRLQKSEWHTHNTVYSMTIQLLCLRNARTYRLFQDIKTNMHTLHFELYRTKLRYRVTLQFSIAPAPSAAFSSLYVQNFSSCAHTSRKRRPNLVWFRVGMMHTLT